MIVVGGRVIIEVSKTLEENCLSNGAQKLSTRISLSQSLLQALSLSKEYRKIFTMMEFSSQWNARLLGRNFSSITMHYFLFLAIHELVSIEFLDTPSLLWLINVVVCLINEISATILVPLRLIKAQGSNFHPIMSRVGVFLK